MPQKRMFEFDLTETFPHLPGAPIVEAVIHWVARASKPFHQDELRQQLLDRVPGYPDCQPQHELQFEALMTQDGSSTEIRRDSWRGLRLTSADKLQIVQFTRDGMVFSRLTPYESWDVFAAEGLRLWKIFVELAAPSEVQRLGVRFINRIQPIKLSEVRRYLAKPPKGLESLGLPLSGFLHQNLYSVPGASLQMNVVQTIQPPTPPKSDGYGLIFDIDVGTTQAFPPADEIVQDYLPKMRWLKNKAFFGLISQKAIQSFEKGKT